MKPYQALCTYEDSPQLPHGYLVCLLMAVSSKRWFEVMNPLVDEYSKSEKGTNLAALAEAERKAEDFVDRVYLVTALIMLTEVFLVYGL